MAGSDDLDKFIKELEKVLKEMSGRTELLKLGKPLAERIVTRTRLGYGVEKTGGERVRLEKLAASTKRQKNYKKKKGSLSALTTPNRSNLTDTGQMLGSIRANVPKEGELRIETQGTRNDDVARYVTEGNRFTPKRPFLDISKPELKGFVDDFRDLLLSKLSKVLKL